MEHRTSQKQGHQANSSCYLNLSPSHSHCFSFCLKCSGQSPPQSSFLLCPCGFQLKAHFSMAVESFLIICPIHFHFCSIICTAICFSCACLHSSPFKKMFGQKILKIFLKSPTKNVCRSLLIHFITFHISYPYRSKDLTYLPKILNFVPIDISLAFHT